MGFAYHRFNHSGTMGEQRGMGDYVGVLSLYGLPNFSSLLCAMEHQSNWESRVDD